MNSNNTHSLIASQTRGIVLVITGLSIAAFAGAIMKLLGDQISPFQVAWWLIGLLVIAGSINQTLLVFAFAHADASTLAPFTYFEIVSAVIFGYLFFDTLPTLLSWGGIFLITVGGIYVARALHVRNISQRAPKI